jgi:putative pre-16S rRNA nuclease
VTLLGFDYGRRRIGVAVGQTITATANPLVTISCRDFKPDWNSIEKLMLEWEPEALVVGMPINMDGSDHELRDRVLRFSRQLHGRFLVPVHNIDERLSSYEAESREEDSRQFGVDSVSAQVILETWFNQ